MTRENFGKNSRVAFAFQPWVGFCGPPAVKTRWATRPNSVVLHGILCRNASGATLRSLRAWGPGNPHATRTTATQGARGTSRSQPREGDGTGTRAGISTLPSGRPAHSTHSFANATGSIIRPAGPPAALPGVMRDDPRPYQHPARENSPVMRLGGVPRGTLAHAADSSRFCAHVAGTERVKLSCLGSRSLNPFLRAPPLLLPGCIDLA